MDNPLVSVCIPAYNAAPFIEEAIECWLNQTYQHIEIIIQDDCSTDDTYSIALAMAEKDHRIKIFRNAKNLGIGPNWNEVYQKTNGEFIIVANADDIYNNDIIERGIRIFNIDNIVDSVSFSYEILDDETGSIQKAPYHEKLIKGIQANLFRTCFFENPFHIIFSIFKKASINQILTHNKLFLETQVCDAELFFRIGKNNFNHYFDDYSAGKYRKHPNNNSLIPNGELNSWLYDVLPLYIKYLKQNYRSKSLKLFREKFLHQIKYAIKNKRKVNIRTLKILLHYYIQII